MISHSEARQFACEAIGTLLGQDPVFNSTRHLAGIGWLETNYGAGWKGAGVGSNNIGAIQAGSSWRGETFEYVDTRPNPDGSSTQYRVAFRKYPNMAAGWNDLARVAYSGVRHGVLVAARMGDTYSVSEYLHRTTYYEGFGATVRDRRYNHFLALRKGVWRADDEAGIETPQGYPSGLPRTVRRGSSGDDVRTLQRELQIAADGLFGPITEQTVREYQADRRLVVDGIVGQATWTALFTDGYVPEG